MLAVGSMDWEGRTEEHGGWAGRRLAAECSLIEDCLNLKQDFPVDTACAGVVAVCFCRREAGKVKLGKFSAVDESRWGAGVVGDDSGKDPPRQEGGCV